MATGRPKKWARKRGLGTAAKRTTQTKQQRRRRKQMIGDEKRGGH